MCLALQFLIGCEVAASRKFLNEMMAITMWVTDETLISRQCDSGTTPSGWRFDTFADASWTLVAVRGASPWNFNAAVLMSWLLTDRSSLHERQ
jgi:hypothetical protein